MFKTLHLELYGVSVGTKLLSLTFTGDGSKFAWTEHSFTDDFAVADIQVVPDASGVDRLYIIAKDIKAGSWW